MNEEKEYLIILEETSIGYRAYCPDLPACSAAGDTKEETVQRMKKVIRHHLEKLREEDIPEPESHAEYVTYCRGSNQEGL